MPVNPALKWGGGYEYEASLGYIGKETLSEKKKKRKRRIFREHCVYIKSCFSFIT